MKYYTLQTLKAWNDAEKKGYLIGNEEFAIEDYKRYYQWIMKQMSINLESYNGEYPIWLWLTLENIHIEDTLEDAFVLLEIELPENKVLLSNFDAWHVILNNGYFGDNEEVNQEEDWQLLFNRDNMEELGFDTYYDEEMQGVTGKIDLKNIKVLKYILNK